jgi:hypothetical protein
MDIKLILDLHDRFLLVKMEETEHKIAFLEGDQRQDEANLYKARRNVFEIFRKMAAVSRKQGDKAVETYRRHLTVIPQNWVEARKQAVQFGDNHRQAVEDMKLEALKEIVHHLNDTMGEGGEEQ